MNKKGEKIKARHIYFKKISYLFTAAVRRDGALVLKMISPTRADLVFEGLVSADSVTVAGADGKDLQVEVSEIEGTGKSVVTLRPSGDFSVTVRS